MAPRSRARWMISVAFCTAVVGCAADLTAPVKAAEIVEEGTGPRTVGLAQFLVERGWQRAGIAASTPVVADAATTGWVCQVDMSSVPAPAAEALALRSGR